MTAQKLTDVLHAQPFRPFRLHLADGRYIEVAHPDFVARSPTGRTALLYHPDDSHEIVDLLLVASIEILNGKRRRRAGRE